MAQAANQRGGRRHAADGVAEVPLADTVYLKIKTAIIHGDLAPGAQIAEQQIATELAVSRTPVHQAIVRLESEGWVKLQPKRGVLISTVTAVEMRAIYEVLTGLEGMAVDRLGRRPGRSDDPVENELRAAAAGAEDALGRGDLDLWAACDDHFHALLVERSGNPYLAALARTVMEQAHRARLLTLRLAKPVTVALIGAGKYGTMFLAQARTTPGMHIVAVADLKIDRARAQLTACHWPDERIAARSCEDAIRSGETFLTDDADALVRADGIEVIIEATGDPRVGSPTRWPRSFRHG